MRRFAGISIVFATSIWVRPVAGAGEDISPLAGALAADPSLPVAALFAGSTGGLVPTDHRLNFDFMFGPYIPTEGGDQDFEVGGTTGFKFQGEVVRYLFLGGEFAYAGHGKDVDREDFFFEGYMNRFYFLAPIEVDLPFYGSEENPFSIRLGAAPGIQLVDPVVDEDVEDFFQFTQGLNPREETEVAFNIRFRVGLRLPLDPHFSFVFETTYDWAEADMETDFEDLINGGSFEKKTETVNLSGVSVLLGFAFVW